MKNREGFSRGFGFVEFANPRDAWKSIQKWNNSFLDRNIIKVQFRRRVFNQRILIIEIMEDLIKEKEEKEILDSEEKEGDLDPNFFAAY